MRRLTEPGTAVAVVLLRNFEFRIPLQWLLAAPVTSANGAPSGSGRDPAAPRFSLWQNDLPVDALPVEGWMELQLLSEEDLTALQ